MNLNFTINLTDIGVGLETIGTRESERQEILDFLVSVDETMADADFTHNLIYQLTVSLTEDVEVRDGDLLTIPGVQEGRQISFSQLYEGLSHMPEDNLIALLANAMMAKRNRDSLAAALAELCVECEHPMGVHNTPCEVGGYDNCQACMESSKYVSLSTPCAGCGHVRNHHTASGNWCTIAYADAEAACRCTGFQKE